MAPCSGATHVQHATDGLPGEALTATPCAQEVCENALSPVLEEIAALHASIPLKSAGELTFPPPIVDVPAAAAVCFGDGCEAPPEAAAPEPSASLVDGIASFGAGLGVDPYDMDAVGPDDVDTGTDLGVVISPPTTAAGDGTVGPSAAPNDGGDGDDGGDDGEDGGGGGPASITLDSLFVDNDDAPAADTPERSSAGAAKLRTVGWAAAAQAAGLLVYCMHVL